MNLLRGVKRRQACSPSCAFVLPQIVSGDLDRVCLLAEREELRSLLLVRGNRLLIEQGAVFLGCRPFEV